MLARKNRTRRARAIMLVPTLAVLGTVAYAGVSAVEIKTAQALPNETKFRYFYSDDTYTNEVGFKIVYSCYGVGGPTVGQETPYYQDEIEGCYGPLDLD